VIPALKLLFAGIFITMVAVTVSAAMQENILLIPAAVAGDPWFMATLFDAYFAFLVIYLWVCFREKSLWIKVVCFFAFALLGNIAISVYVLIALFKLETGAGAEALFARKT
jgi:hypothetical protein